MVTEAILIISNILAIQMRNKSRPFVWSSRLYHGSFGFTRIVSGIASFEACAEGVIVETSISVIVWEGGLMGCGGCNEDGARGY